MYNLYSIYNRVWGFGGGDSKIIPAPYPSGYFFKSHHTRYYWGIFWINPASIWAGRGGYPLDMGKLPSLSGRGSWSTV